MKIPQIKANRDGQLSPGKNLKRIRKEMGLRQHEITKNIVTRNLISLIENEKTPLYERNARLIAETINQVNQEKGVFAYLDTQDILDPEKYDAKKVANTYIEKLQQKLAEKDYEILEDELAEVEKLLTKWNIPDSRAIIYELLGDMQHESQNKTDAFYYYFKALDNYLTLPIRFENEQRLLIKLVLNCIDSESYGYAQKLLNSAYLTNMWSLITTWVTTITTVHTALKELGRTKNPWEILRKL